MISAKEARELFESRTEARVADTLALIEECILEAEVPVVSVGDEFNTLSQRQQKMALEELTQAGYQVSYVRDTLYVQWDEPEPEPKPKVETGPFSVRIPLNGVHNVYFRSRSY